ncbi:MAG TPA: hypothetical protein VNT57_01940 [Desulfobacteria bacterium]|nr:hypothetical protein [Desulfobacteria bacterium]
MTKKLSLIFLFHVFCLGLLFVPDKYQGPIALVVSGVNLRVLDAAAVLLIILATAVLFIYILRNLMPEIKQLQELNRAEEKNRKKPDTRRK